MPKHGNIFTNWFKSSKQKQKKSPQQHPIKNQSNVESAFEQTSTAIKRSPLVPRQPTNGSRNDLSSRSCRTSMFGLTFGLVSSTGSSKLSLLFGNSKQALQHKSPSCTETQSNLNDQQQQQQNGSILRKIPAHFEGHQKNVSSTTHSQLIESPTTPPGKQSATSVTQLHLSRTSPHSSIRGLVNSSPQNVASAEATISTSTPDQTNFTNTALSVSNPSLKQTAEILSSLDHSSAFTPISSLCATVEKTQKPVLQVQTITQQQKQIQFRQQHSDQLCDVQKPTYSQSINEHDQENSPNIMTSSGVTTTLNESFTELNQDSSDAEIVQVFTGGKQLAKSRASTLDLSDEQLIFSGTQSKKKARGNRRSYSTTLFSSVSNEKQLKELERKNSRSSKSPAKESTESAIDKKVFDELGNKKASFVDENENLESTMFSKCKIGHRDDFPETMSQDEKIDRLEDGKVLKTKSVELNELTDSIELKEQQQGDEEADSFGELPANGEDFSLYENVTGLGDDLKFLASMPELCDITFLVGENREPVCAVSAVLGSRSRVFHKLLYGQKTHSNQQYSSNLDGDLPPIHEQSTRRSIFGRRKESTVDESCTMNDSKRPREESITGALLRYSKSKKFKETKDAKSKYSLKRGSEPILEGLPLNQQIKPSVHQIMIIEEFEPDVFRQLIEYIHTGCVTLQARTLLGLMNAADYYGLEELRKSCMGFVGACITVDTVCTLLASAERYIQYKCTKSLVQRVLEFVDNHGNEVLSLGSFALLPEHVVRLIFSREELKADELIKFQAALHWSQRYCEGSPGTADLREIMKGFFEYIEFYKIPTIVLMREVHPLNIVPDHIIMNALAYQADPKSIDICKVESPNRFRRMTLPHALNIAGSEMLSNLHRQSLVPLKCERSASTSTSGYNTECSMFSANNTSNGNLGLGTSIKSKKDERDENGRNNENEKFDAGKSISKHKKDKEKDFQNKVGKRRGSRPFRRAITLFEGKGRHT